MVCPFCGSSNTRFDLGEEEYDCNDCGERFEEEDGDNSEDDEDEEG